jgi:hypothetical protein
MRIDEVVRKAIPNASDELVDFIVWNRTPYPIGRVTAESLYKAADRFERARRKGIYLCTFCDNKVENIKQMTCKRCEESLKRTREIQEAELEDSGKFHRPDDIVQLVDTEHWPFP